MNSDVWLLENVSPTIFAERAGDACDSLFRWSEDLDLIRALGLNSYRFSLEWSRIEPDEGYFSSAMLDHYKAMIAGCRQRGITPVVTFNHFALPRWFAAAGGWEVPEAAARFARYCERAAQALAEGIGYATTLNEPNALRLVPWLRPPLPAQYGVITGSMLKSAAQACGAAQFVPFVTGDAKRMLNPTLDAHRQGYAAIKAVRPDLPVGVSFAVSDDQAVGPHSQRDEKRRDVYGAWMEVCKDHADFVGVQNYVRQHLGKDGPIPSGKSEWGGQGGDEVNPESVEGAVTYVHQATGKPIMVTENGIGTADDTLRARYIPLAIASVSRAMRAGVPVLGYIHWSLLDSFEWSFGYAPKMGLVAVDRHTQKRTPKPSAEVYGAIARSNGL